MKNKLIATMLGVSILLPVHVSADTEEETKEEKATEQVEEVTEGKAPVEENVEGAEEESKEDEKEPKEETAPLTTIKNGDKDKYGNVVDDIGRLYSGDKVIARDVVKIENGVFYDREGNQFTAHGTRYNDKSKELYGATNDPISTNVAGVNDEGVPYTEDNNLITLAGHVLLPNGNVVDASNNVLGTLADGLNIAGKPVDVDGKEITILTAKDVSNFGNSKIEEIEEKHVISGKVWLINIMVSIIVGVGLSFILQRWGNQREYDEKLLEDYYRERDGI